MEYDEDDVADILGGSSAYNTVSARPPCPKRGLDRNFDRYCDEEFGMLDPEEVDMDELRRAAWATWKVSAPMAISGPSGSSVNEDDELQRAIALSVEEHSNRPSRRNSLIPDDGEDEELRRAIALSQQETERVIKKPRREETPEEERKALAEAMAASTQQTKEVVEEVSDDEELHDANAAFVASREAYRQEEMKRRQAKRDKVSGPASATIPSLPTPPPSAQAGAKNVPIPPPTAYTITRMGPGAIDRAQMEKERLARQAARAGQSGEKPANGGAPGISRASTSHTTTNSSSGVKSLTDLKARESNGNLPTAAANRNDAGPSHAYRPTEHPLQAAGPFPSDAAGEYYLDSELRHTAMSIGSPSKERTFSPQQVIGKTSEIALVIMSSFVVDDEWLATIMPPPEQVPTVMIRPHPKDMHPAWNGKVQAQANGEVRCYPEMVGEWGSAHMKFAWIFYKTGRLRVSIQTANMVPYDWDWIENTVFVQDFLPTKTSSPRSSPKGDDFYQRFRWLFIHLKVHKALRFLVNHHPEGGNIPFKQTEAFEDMIKYDWSRVRVRLVMSVPGNYDGLVRMNDFGLCRLGKVLSDEGWKPAKGEMAKTEFQGSSLGTYSLEWFDTYYQCCTGRTAAELVGRPKANSWPPMKIIFPSLATVDNSILGRDGGGTMFCSKAMNGVTRPLFHDANSKRGGVLMHAKVLIAIFEPRGQSLGLQATPEKNGKRKQEGIEDGSASGVGGWVYVGSHNFSSAAWGTVNLKKATPTLNVRNYELGIVFPLPRGKANAVADKIAPYVRPPRPYSSTDMPWDQKIHQTAQ